MVVQDLLFLRRQQSNQIITISHVNHNQVAYELFNYEADSYK